MSRVRARYLGAAYIVTVLVLRGMDTARESGGLPGWTFWVIDVPLSAAVVGVGVMALLAWVTRGRGR
ncbi:MAG: hypothetical protein WA988_17920 [Candidatus Nanopelagicales bacterium]